MPLTQVENTHVQLRSSDGLTFEVLAQGAQYSRYLTNMRTRQIHLPYSAIVLEKVA